MTGLGLRRLAAYAWAGPTSLLGLCFVPLALVGRGRARLVDGVMELHGPAIDYLLRHAVPLADGAAAVTLGHVVLGRDEACLDRCRDHERVHVRQCERWGPLFIPAYLSVSLWMALRGRDPYRDNPFEREAFGTLPSSSSPSPNVG